MKPPVFLSFSILIFLCMIPAKKIHDKTAVDINNTQNNCDTINNITKKTSEIKPENIKPIIGYRFVISGDFDGDGKQEQLTEHYYSAINHTETNKWYADIDYEDLVRLTMQKEPYTFLLSDNARIDTFRISNTPQQLGLSYLKNEGDLNGDGTDEISYVVNHADWSSLNIWYIATYKDNQWQILYSFTIWDWQLPDLPGTANQYGLFGLMDKNVIAGSDTINQLLEKQLLEFEGLVKKTGPGQIQVIYHTDEAEIDTMIVTLRACLNFAR